MFNTEPAHTSKRHIVYPVFRIYVSTIAYFMMCMEALAIKKPPRRTAIYGNRDKCPEKENRQ